MAVLGFLIYILLIPDSLTRVSPEVKDSLLLHYDLMLDQAFEMKKKNPDSVLLIYNHIISDLIKVSISNPKLGLQQSENLLNTYASALYGAGDAWHSKGDMDQALKLYYEALQIFKKTRHLSGLGSVYNNIGLVYLYGLNETNSAEEHFLKARSFFNKANDSLNLSVVFVNLGALYKIKADYQRALNYYDTCLTFYQINKDKHGEGQALFNLATLLYQKGEQTKALEQLRKCEQIFTDEEYDLIWLGHTYTSMAFIFFNQNNHNGAFKNARKAYEIGKEFRHFEILRRATNILHKIYKQRQDWEKAFKFLREYISFKDSSQSEEKRMQILKQQIRFENEKRSFSDSLNHALAQKEMEIILEEQAQRIKSISQNRNGFIAALLLLFLIIWQILKRIEINRFKKGIELNIQLLKLEHNILKVQVNSELIHKSMNFVQRMLDENQRGKARNYLISFSKFIRAVLEGSKRDAYSLQDEIEALRQYLQLEQIRLGESIVVNFQVNVKQELKHFNMLWLKPLMVDVIDFIEQLNEQIHIAIILADSANGDHIQLDIHLQVINQDLSQELARMVDDYLITMNNLNIRNHIASHHVFDNSINIIYHSIALQSEKSLYEKAV
jgi:tetratricopeptide (TPR) repeat protein